MNQATVLGHIPSQVSSQVDVQDAIFPDEDYTSDDTDGADKEKPPVVWVDATPVREIPADRTTAQTVMVGHHSLPPIQIVPRNGNNQRKHVRIRNVSAQEIWLLTGDSQPSTPIVSTVVVGVDIISNAYLLAANAEYVHTSAAPLWAVHAEAVVTDLFALTMMTDSYTPSDKR
jgi:hypothetical protein